MPSFNMKHALDFQLDMVRAMVRAAAHAFVKV